MSTAGRPDASAPAESVAATCRDAGLVRLVASADGDALAALGILARAFRATGVPFQASLQRVPRPSGTDADVTVTLGTDGGDVALVEGPLSQLAGAVARELGVAPDPVLALAGTVAAGAEPDERANLMDAFERGVERRPGVAIPVADPIDGLAHTTLAHAQSFSGDPEATRDALGDVAGETPADEEARKRLASAVALRSVEAAPPRAAESVERVLRPYAGGPFETVDGYADLLDALARTAPGVGISLVVDDDPTTQVREAALDAWRDHGRRAHAAVRAADTARYDGLLVARIRDGPVGTVARLLRDFRSPEPVVLVLTDGEAAAASVDRGAVTLLDAAAAATGATAGGRDGLALATDVEDADAFTEAFREAVDA